MARATLGLSRIVLVAVMVAGCRLSDAVGDARSTPIPDTESSPEAVSRVVSTEPNAPIGMRLHLQNGVVLPIEPSGTKMLFQGPNTVGAVDSLALYGHDQGGSWVVWLAGEDNASDCYAFPKIGYDRKGFIGWPDD